MVQLLELKFNDIIMKHEQFDGIVNIISAEPNAEQWPSACYWCMWMDTSWDCHLNRKVVVVVIVIQHLTNLWEDREVQT